MSRVRSNIAANVAGQGWTVLLALVCTPLYIHLLGIEAYGLIAFLIVVQSILQLLDLGLATTVNREVARYSASPEAGTAAIAGFVVTLERWYWALGAVVSLLLFAALPVLTEWWLQPEALSRDELTWSARVFAVLALLQWPSLFYQSALAGMQRQVAVNAIQMPFATLGSIGGVLFIWLGPRSVVALLGWQAAMLLVHLAVLRGYFWRHVGFARSEGMGVLSVVRQHWRFSVGMSGINVTGLILTHLDKLILSRLLTLQSFGHYSLAVTVARGLYVLITPVFGAYFPRLSMLVAKGDGESVRACYHTATQLMAVLILPTALIIAMFPEPLIGAWLHDEALASTVAPVASLLVLGTCLNGLMNIPFALQLAHGNTRIGLTINMALIAILVPSIAYAAINYGAIGGATMWAVSNLLYLLVGIPITHKRLLQHASSAWLVSGILPSLACSLIVVGLGRLLMEPTVSIGSLAAIGSLWLLATLASGATSGHIRKHAWLILHNWSRA